MSEPPESQATAHITFTALEPIGDPCEGGCGCLVAPFPGTGKPYETAVQPAARDDLTDELLPEMATFVAEHTAARCALLKQIRLEMVAAFAKRTEHSPRPAEVTIHAHDSNRLTVQVQLCEVVTQDAIGVRTFFDRWGALVQASGLYVIEEMPRDRLMRWAELIAESAVQVFEEPWKSSGGFGQLDPLIARDPYQRR